MVLRTIAERHAPLPEITLRPAEDGDLPQIVNLDRRAFAPLSTNDEIERYAQGLDLPNRSKL